MVPPKQLDPTEQDALVKQIGLAMLRAAPEDWDRVTVDFRAVGRYCEVDGEIMYADEEVSDWPVPPEITTLFTELRAGMYRDGRGTWFNATYRLDHPSSYNLDYDRDEPEWRQPPPPQAYADDLQTFPRTGDNIPEWLMRRVRNQPAELPGQRFRMARIFDGQAGGGRPLVNRPTVPERDRGPLLEYLNSGPVISSNRTLEIDRLDPEGRQIVPVAFHTDGTWIWPAAVNFYLHNYGISPELDLVEHIRRQSFRVPEVDEATRAAAVGFLGRGRPPARREAPPRPMVDGSPRLPDAGPRPPVPVPVPAPAPTMAMPRPEANGRNDEPHGDGPHGDASPRVRGDRPPAGFRPPSGPPPAALPSQGPPAATIDALRSRLSALGVPDSVYRIGPPTERTWSMDQTPEGWRVGWYERDFVAPAIFEDVADAAAFLLGKIMLDANRPTPAPPPEEATVRSDPVEPRPAKIPNPSTRRTREPEPTLPEPSEVLAPSPAEPAARRAREPEPPPAQPEPAARQEREPEPTLPEPGPRHDREPEPTVFAPNLGEPGARRAREPEPEPTMFTPNLAEPAPRRAREPEPTLPEPGPRHDREPEPTVFAPNLAEPAARRAREPEPPPALPEPVTRREREPEPTMFAPNLAEPAPRRAREPEPTLPEPGPRHDREPEPTVFAPSLGEPAARRAREPEPPPALPEPAARRERVPEPSMFEPSLPEPSMFTPNIAEPGPRRVREPEPTMVAPSLGEPAARRERAPEPGGRRVREPEPEARAAEGGRAQQRWPVQPLSGEPPLTLFRGKRMVELAPGTEVDRFGNPDGNLTYAAGTPFSERSLVPDWIERPYHTYRVERPVQALSGTAIPWFEQAGGGTAYVLPEAIEELLANGVLSEVPGRKPPTG